MRLGGQPQRNRNRNHTANAVAVVNYFDIFFSFSYMNLLRIFRLHLQKFNNKNISTKIHNIFPSYNSKKCSVDNKKNLYALNLSVI